MKIIPIENNTPKFCPFVENPFEECFCFDFHKNRHVKLAVFYCSKNFRQCDIYQKNKESLKHFDNKNLDVSGS